MTIKHSFMSVVMHIVLLITFLGLIGMIFNLHGFAFILEFLILLGLLLFGLAAVVGLSNNLQWVWKLLVVFFGLVFIDMLLVYVFSSAKTEFFSQYLFVVVAGFFISLFSVGSPKAEKKPKKKVKKAEAKAKASKTANVSKTFKPGKFIASKTGSKYHAPKCDWAKRVKKKNAVWFDNKADAKKAGYKADSCIK